MSWRLLVVVFLSIFHSRRDNYLFSLFPLPFFPSSLYLFSLLLFIFFPSSLYLFSFFSLPFSFFTHTRRSNYLVCNAPTIEKIEQLFERVPLPSQASNCHAARVSFASFYSSTCVREIFTTTTTAFIFTAPFQDEELNSLVRRGEKMEQTYGRLFDHVIVNDDIDESYGRLQEICFALENEPQWVPAEWVSWSGTRGSGGKDELCRVLGAVAPRRRTRRRGCRRYSNACACAKKRNLEQLGQSAIVDLSEKSSLRRCHCEQLSRIRYVFRALIFFHVTDNGALINRVLGGQRCFRTREIPACFAWICFICFARWKHQIALKNSFFRTVFFFNFFC